MCLGVRRGPERREGVEGGPFDGWGFPFVGEGVVVAEASELVGKEGRGGARGVDAGEDLVGGWGERAIRKKEEVSAIVVVVVVVIAD